MKTMRVLFHNGAWVDVAADFYRDDGDDWVTLRKGAIDNQSESEIVAFFATHLVLGVVQPEMLVDRNIIPDGAGNVAEIVSNLQARIEALEALVPPVRVTKPRNPLGAEIVPLCREDPNWIPASIESIE